MKKNKIIFALMILIIMLLSILILVQLQRKVGYAYRIHFLNPNIPKDEIIKAISSVDQSYLEGIHTIEIVDIPLSYDSLYILGGKIRLNVKDSLREEVLLHELKHHYCWKKEKYLGHEGCFKEPPLVIEETIIDEVITPPTQEEKLPSCFDEIQNQNETGVDCGGPCVPCEKETIEMFAPAKIGIGTYILIGFYLVTICAMLITSYYKRNI